MTMIPFVHVPSVEVGPLTLHPFGMLAATAVAVGTWLAHRRARSLGIDREELASFVTWMLAGGFIGGHVIDALFYRPASLVEDPLSILFLWRSQGSTGGFIGAVLGAVAWKYLDAGKSPFDRRLLRLRREPRPLLPIADLILSVFPVAWIFGRMGCAVAHDHPGRLASLDHPLAVAYGPERAVAELPLGIELRYGTAPRFDLGLLEMLLAMAISVGLVLAWRRRTPVGFYVAAVPLAYAPARFALDFLRATDLPRADARYGALTPAQWAMILLFSFGLATATILLRRPGDGDATWTTLRVDDGDDLRG